MGMGRPRNDFNWDVVDALASIKASERYIAEYLLKKQGIAPFEIDNKMVSKTIKLIQRRIKERWGISFVQFRDQKQDVWKIELTQLQRQAARSGRVAMQIWLGKQDLGQTEKIINNIETSRPEVILTLPVNGREANSTKKDD